MCCGISRNGFSEVFELTKKFSTKQTFIVMADQMNQDNLFVDMLAVLVAVDDYV